MHRDRSTDRMCLCVCAGGYRSRPDQLKQSWIQNKESQLVLEVIVGNETLSRKLVVPVLLISWW